MVIILISLAAFAAVKGYRKHSKHSKAKKAKKQLALDDSSSTYSASTSQSQAPSVAASTERQPRGRRNFTTNRAPEADPPPPYIANENLKPPAFSIVADPNATITDADVHPAFRGSGESSRDAPTDNGLLNPHRNSDDNQSRASERSSVDMPIIRVTDDGMMEVEVDSAEEAIAREEMEREAREQGRHTALVELDSAEAHEAVHQSLTSDGMQRPASEWPEPLIPIPPRSPMRAASPAISGRV